MLQVKTFTELLAAMKSGTKEFNVYGGFLPARFKEWADFSNPNRPNANQQHISNGIAASLVSLGGALSAIGGGSGVGAVGGAAMAGYAAVYGENVTLMFNYKICDHYDDEYQAGINKFVALAADYTVVGHMNAVTFTKK